MEGGQCSIGGLLIGGGGVLGCGVFLGAEAWLSLSCTAESEINKPHTGMAHTAATLLGNLGSSNSLYEGNQQKATSRS